MGSALVVLVSVTLLVPSEVVVVSSAIGVTNVSELVDVSVTVVSVVECRVVTVSAESEPVVVSVSVPNLRNLEG